MTKNTVATTSTPEAAREAYDLISGLVLDDDGTTWGEVATDWQRADALAVLGGDRWVLLSRGRGMSKTSDVAGLVLALLLTAAPRRSRSYVYACDQDQASELLDVLAGFVERTPGLAGAVTIGADRVMVKATGAALRIETSDGASAMGKRPWLVVADELSFWGSGGNARRLWSAIVSSMPKVRGARLLVMCTGGDPSHWAARVLERAARSSRWLVSVTPGPAPWWDGSDLAAATELLTVAEVAQLIGAEWVASASSLTSPEDVARCVSPGVGRRGHDPRFRYVVAVDVGTRRDRSAVVVAHEETGPGGGRLVVVDVVRWWTPSRSARVEVDDVEAAVRSLVAEFGAAVVYDRMQAEQMAQRLVASGVRCHEFVFSSAGADALARRMMVGLRDATLRLVDVEEYTDELAAVRIVETTAGRLKLANERGRFDDMCQATAMAAEFLLSRPQHRPVSWASPLGAPMSEEAMVAAARRSERDRVAGLGGRPGGRCATGRRSQR